ncbi:uncharacterized protein PAN0_010d4160 [Moesziomyces antarcticus]|nr:uncharacterized protein PAN0_010d4160 [Moesziomyces antarcticus]GAK65938.1 hypothetical protein PAN0_010d4160 [Moesziomyces antarcticus]
MQPKQQQQQKQHAGPVLWSLRALSRSLLSLSPAVTARNPLPLRRLDAPPSLVTNNDLHPPPLDSYPSA